MLSQTAISLASAMLAGQNCWYGLHDALLDCDEPILAKHFSTARKSNALWSRIQLHRMLGKLTWLTKQGDALLFTSSTTESVCSTMGTERFLANAKWTIPVVYVMPSLASYVEAYWELHHTIGRQYLTRLEPCDYHLHPRRISPRSLSEPLSDCHLVIIKRARYPKAMDAVKRILPHLPGLPSQWRVRFYREAASAGKCVEHFMSFYGNHVHREYSMMLSYDHDSIEGDPYTFS